MRVYAVYEPPARNTESDADLMRHAERFKFVRDGFSWTAFLFTPLWMLRHRLWLALLVYIAIVGGLGFAIARGLVPQGASAALLSLLDLLIGFEAATLRRRKLLRWRWRDLGIVAAENLLAAEQRFFDRWVAHGPAGDTPPTSPANDSTRSRAPTATGSAAAAEASGQAAARTTAYDPDSYVIGMLPTPGGRR